MRAADGAVLIALCVGGCTTSLGVTQLPDRSPPAPKKGEATAPEQDGAKPRHQRSATHADAKAVAAAKPKSVGGLPAGFVYHLPAAVLTPQAVLVLDGCPVDEEAAKLLIAPAKKAKNDAEVLLPITGVKFVVVADLTVEQVRDQMIVIDYRDLKSPFKTSTVGLERHPNGMLKSVNAGIEDESPAIIADVAATVAGIAVFAANPAAAASAAAGTAASNQFKANVAAMNLDPNAAAMFGGQLKSKAPIDVSFAACSAKTRQALDKRDVAAKKRKEAKSSLEAVTAELQKFLVNASTGFDPAEVSKVRNLSRQITTLSTDITTLGAEIDEINDGLKLPLRLTDGETILPSALGAGVTLRPDPARLQFFLDTHFATGSRPVRPENLDSFNARTCQYRENPATGKVEEIQDQTCGSVEAISAVATKIAVVTIKEKPVAALRDPGDRRPDPADMGSRRRPKHGLSGELSPANRGIVYIEPKYIRIVLDGVSIGPGSDPARPKPLKIVNAAIPQLGQYMTLPVSAAFGEKVELKASFAEDGSLLTGSFGRPKAMGKAISGAVRGAVETAVAAQTAVEDRRAKLLATKEDRDLKILTNQLAAANTQVGIAEAGRKLTANPLEELNTKIALKSAEATLAEIEVRIKAAGKTLAE